MTDIQDEKDFYHAIRNYTNKIWEWRAHLSDDFEDEPTPDELIEILTERIEWVEAHKSAVEKYLRKRQGATWFRVIEGSRQRE